MIKFERAFVNDMVSKSKSEVIEFWESLGYKFKSKTGNEVFGYRGRLINNFFTMNMKKLSTKIAISFMDDLPNYTKVVINVHTVGQMILKEEAILWPSELEIFNHFLQDKTVDIEAYMKMYDKDRKKAQKKLAIILGIPLFIMIVIIVAFSILP